MFYPENIPCALKLHSFSLLTFPLVFLSIIKSGAMQFPTIIVALFTSPLSSVSVASCNLKPCGSESKNILSYVLLID